jgi:Xaa-Pro aminopeptidase
MRVPQLQSWIILSAFTAIALAGGLILANVGTVGLDWQERVNWDRLRKYRLERARERMKAHGLGALLLMYDENVRYVTSTLTPGWNRLKPGLRYALLCGDDAPVLFEQGDIGMHIAKHSPWIPKHAEYIPNGVWAELKKFYFDFAHASYAMAMPNAYSRDSKCE